MPDGDKYKILLIEDNKDVLKVIKLSLEMLGYDVTGLSSGSDAIEQFSELQPEVAIIDQGLPLMQGIDVGRSIRKLPSGNNCALVLLTGTDGPLLREAAKEAGFNDFLVKPVKMKMLSACVQMLIAK